MTTITVPISSKAQITIPKLVREKLGLDGGKFVNIVLDDGHISIQNPKTHSRPDSGVDPRDEYDGEWDVDFTEGGTKTGMPVKEFLEILEKSMK